MSSPDNTDNLNFKFVEIGNSYNYDNDSLVHINEMTSGGATGKKWNSGSTIDP